MKFLFILDPYASLKLVKDTSVAMMREAAAQGHQLFVCQQQDIFLRHDVVHLKTQAFSFRMQKTGMPYQKSQSSCQQTLMQSSCAKTRRLIMNIYTVLIY